MSNTLFSLKLLGPFSGVVDFNSEANPPTLEQLKQMIAQRGYTIETDADGTERLIRPDGTVAVIARQPPKH